MCTCVLAFTQLDMCSNLQPHIHSTSMRVSVLLPTPIRSLRVLPESGVSEVVQGVQVMRETEAWWAVFWGSDGKAGLGDCRARCGEQWESGSKEHLGSEPSGS